MTLLEIVTVLGLLAFVVALSALGSRSRIPGPTLMVVAGLLIGVVPGLPHFALNPDMVFLVFLPPILYGAAWNTWLADFRRHLASISLLASPTMLGIAALLLVAAIAGKGIACGVAARFAGESKRDSFAIGALMNARGLMELILLNIGYERGVITQTLFTILVLMAVVKPV